MSGAQTRSQQMHPLWVILLSALAFGLLLSVLWATAAHGDPPLLRKLLPWISSQPYGPDHPLYNGWAWISAAVSVLCISIALMSYLVYRVRVHPAAARTLEGIDAD